MKYLTAVIPLIAGFILDTAVGDPYNFPHPVRAMGKLISLTEKFVRKKFRSLGAGGIFLALCVIVPSVLFPLLLLRVCYKVSTVLGVIVESILCCYMVASRCLYNESIKVYRKAVKGDTEGARSAVSMIVGRDTDSLDMCGIVKATVETVAENTSDGVTAPLFYMGIGGATVGFFYKAVNTLDSMIGYKDEKYADIGRFSAKLDDALNYIPSRLTAMLMIVASGVIKCDPKNAWRIWRRDRRKHASPNSAQTESVCAGALHIRLAGDAWYFGKLYKKEYIGDDDRPVKPDDIRSANRLMYVSSVLMLVLSCALRAVIIRNI